MPILFIFPVYLTGGGSRRVLFAMQKHMPEKDTQEQIVEVIPKTEADSGAQLPEHAILRFARFLLPKIQEDFEKKEKKP